MKKRSTVCMVVLLVAIIMMISSPSITYAFTAADLTVTTSFSPTSKLHVGDTVQFTMTVKNANTNSEEAPGVVVTDSAAGKKFFDLVSLIDDSVEVDGNPVSYTYDSIDKTLRVSLGNIPAGEERVLTYTGTLVTEGQLARSWRVSTQGAGFKIGGGTSVTISPKAETYTVTYDANTGNGTVTDATSSYPSGSIVTVLSGNSLSKENCTFVGWTLDPDGSGTVYNEGDKLTILDTNVVLYAKWEEGATATTAETTKYNPTTTQSTQADESTKYNSPAAQSTETGEPSANDAGGANEKGKDPQTGDNSNIALFIGLATLAAMAAGITAVPALRRRLNK